MINAARNGTWMFGPTETVTAWSGNIIDIDWNMAPAYLTECHNLTPNISSGFLINRQIRWSK